MQRNKYTLRLFMYIFLYLLRFSCDKFDFLLFVVSRQFFFRLFALICMQGKSKRPHVWIYFWVIITRLWKKFEFKIILKKKTSLVYTSEDDIPLSYSDKARLSSPLMFLNKYFKICLLVRGIDFFTIIFIFDFGQSVDFLIFSFYL